MDITELSTAVNQPVNSITVGVAVLSKSLDTIDQLGQGLIKMMEQSVQPGLGQTIDVRI
ncbi:MAG: putative motility protein [Lachnospiraceae bacterium]|nr:putative motility protein [Lachnospiraceae bacterium]